MIVSYHQIQTQKLPSTRECFESLPVKRSS
jgi:hypothetical protein